MTTKQVPREELRFAVVMNGGVSLAVWMGGATLEIDRVTRREGPYGDLLDLVSMNARADVISGTSAGGINGAALALAQVNADANLVMLRDVWAEQGRMESLLREPFRGQPPSLLKGDEFFLPQIDAAFRRLATPFTANDARPIDLTITTTLLRGTVEKMIDSLGQELYQQDHEGRFHFRHDPGGGSPYGHESSDANVPDAFDKERIERTARHLALASRATAGFPIAFEPTFIPVEASDGATHPAGPNQRPDMGDVVSWRAEPGASQRDRSRYAVDGGVLVNTPTKAALEAIDRMEADGPVRRVMLLLHPHAAGDLRIPPDREDARPELTRSTIGLVGVMSGQGSRSFVNRIEEHNRARDSHRATRRQLLEQITADSGTNPAQELHDLAQMLLPHYTSLRIRAAGVLVRLVPEVDGWPVERIREAVLAAQRAWPLERDKTCDGEGQVPYVPDSLADGRAPADVVLPWLRHDERPSDRGPGVVRSWPWGTSAVEHLAASAIDLLRDLVWVLPSGNAYKKVAELRKEVYRQRKRVRDLRDALDAAWVPQSIGETVANNKSKKSVNPNQAYWNRRLRFYQFAMFEDAPELSSDAPRPPSAGAAQLEPAWIGRHAADAAIVIARVVRRACRLASHEDVTPDRIKLVGLGPWLDMLAAPAIPAEDGLEPARRMLARLLDLGVVVSCLGDTTDTESEQAIELAQISLHADNPFALHSQTPDDKAAGMALNRFSGFLKRSWRVNDWIWGRMDAATILCRVLLDPRRLRRVAELKGSLRTPGQDPEKLAKQTLDELVLKLLGTEIHDDLNSKKRPDEDRLRHIRDAYDEALKELTTYVFYDDRTPRTASTIDQLPRSLPALARLAAWGVHWRIATDELPALAAAVRSDAVEGASKISRGEIFEQIHRSLINELKPGRRDATSPTDGSSASDATGTISPADGARQTNMQSPSRSASMATTSQPDPEHVDRGIDALAAFDQAGIGREEMTVERSSDQMIRTAATAAGVALTVADGTNTGFTAARPVTRALRGVALLPYWVVMGLTQGGSIARFLVLLALAAGGMLTALAIMAPLPDWASGPAAAIGAASLLSAFGYAAVRTGTLLHSIVLLTPVVPLVVYAAYTADGAADDIDHGIAVAIAIVAVAGGLILLGSLPAPVRSPAALLGRIRSIVKKEPVAPKHGNVPAWLRLVGRALVALMSFGLAAGVLTVVTVLLIRIDVRTLPPGAVTVGSVAAAAVGGAVAWVTGRTLRRWRQDADGTWTRGVVTHPAGVTAGWSVIYGIGYLIVANGLLWLRPGDLEGAWTRVAIAACLGFAVVLLVATPLWGPRRAQSAIVDEILADAVLATQIERSDWNASRLRDRLVARDWTYAFLVTDDGKRLKLTQGGHRINGLLLAQSNRRAVAHRAKP